ncbi:AraC family transcriptional regulator [uncultured Ruminococcus sp.]|uniref:AraC family transcriptional regulator n=1 Tax=uncultured Ruminococcus sp. TaxID=165186 RepID=UPI00266B53A2|nr:AraC family transcriptional regulator [uncultured Ruminococcus sp.]
MQNLIFSIFPNQNFVDLGLFQFGWERCTPAHSFGPAARNHYLFHYILSGTGTLMADDSKGVTQTYSIKSMQGFMIFPNQITTYVADKQLPWEYVWLEFDGLRVKSLLDTVGLSLDKPVYHARNKSLREDMANEMLYISRHKDESPFHLIGHLYLFLDYLLRSAADEQLEHGSKLREFYIHEALTYIEHNFQNEITIEDIAGVCGLNRTYFGKIFKEALGKTPQEFLLNYRMLKAAELLKLTSLSIGDVGLAVGYANQMHFSRAFKNNYGISPREWRYQNHINNTVDSDEEHTQ